MAGRTRKASSVEGVEVEEAEVNDRVSRKLRELSEIQTTHRSVKKRKLKEIAMNRITVIILMVKELLTRHCSLRRT